MKVSGAASSGIDPRRGNKSRLAAHACELINISMLRDCSGKILVLKSLRVLFDLRQQSRTLTFTAFQASSL